MAKTAKELMDELAKEKKYQEMMAAKQKEREALERMYDEDEREMLGELAAIGFKLSSVWDLVKRPNDYDPAIPILIKHLILGHHPRILSGILRALAIPTLSTNEKLWQIVVDIYKSTKSDVDVDVPIERGLQEAAAIAIEALASKSRIADLEDIVASRPKGDGIRWIKERLEHFHASG